MLSRDFFSTGYSSVVGRAGSVVAIWSRHLESYFGYGVRTLGVNPRVVRAVSYSSGGPSFFSSRSGARAGYGLHVEHVLCQVRLPSQCVYFFSVVVGRFFQCAIGVSCGMVQLSLVFVGGYGSFVCSGGGFYLFYLGGQGSRVFFRRSPARGGYSLARYHLGSPWALLCCL